MWRSSGVLYLPYIFRSLKRVYKPTVVISTKLLKMSSFCRNMACGYRERAGLTWATSMCGEWKVSHRKFAHVFLPFSSQFFHTLKEAFGIMIRKLYQYEPVFDTSFYMYMASGIRPNSPSTATSVCPYIHVIIVLPTPSKRLQNFNWIRLTVSQSLRPHISDQES